MNETPLTFDVPSNETVDIQDATSITIKTSNHEKTRCIVVLECYADGIKLSPLLIFR
jgi:hypothetical protein